MDALDITLTLVMGLIIGPAIGNYATSVVYRLPLGQTPFEKHPYCGSCNTMLKPRDLFPIWSYVFLRGRCRHCGVHIPPIHTIVEVACGAIFTVNFLVMGFGETFLLTTALGVFWVMLAALQFQQNKLYPLILTFCFFLAAIPRLLADGSIYPMISSSFVLFFIVVASWRLWQGKRAVTPEDTGYRVPDFAILAGLAGTMLPLKLAAIALLMAGAAHLCIRKPALISSLVGVCAWAVLLYSQSNMSL